MAKKKSKKKNLKKKDLKKKEKKKKELKKKKREKRERKKKGLKVKEIREDKPKKIKSKKKGGQKKEKKRKIPIEKPATAEAPAGTTTDHSSNYNARDAVRKLRTLKSAEQVQEFTKGEQRLTVTQVIPGVMKRFGTEQD